MTNKDADFETWFDLLKMNLDNDGIVFTDADSVKDDYNSGKDMHDVADEIRCEYEC